MCRDPRIARIRRTQPGGAPDGDRTDHRQPDRPVRSRHAEYVVTSGPTAITGVVGNLVGIDYRPRTGELFAVGDDGAVYIVNATTGAATPIGTAPVDQPVHERDRLRR